MSLDEDERKKRILARINVAAEERKHRAPMFAAAEERKRGIIEHMNKDHVRELGYFLRHYARAPRRLVVSPFLHDISLDTMVIRSWGEEYKVPISPPLASWDELRPRVVEMDATAREGLGISDVRITEFAPPEGFDIVVFSGLLFYFSCLGSLSWLEPGTLLWNILETVFPGGPTWFVWLTKMTFLPTLVIHLTEAFFFDRRKMDKYGVDRWSKVWCLWVGSCLIEGFTAFKRIDRVAERKRAQKAAKKS